MEEPIFSCRRFSSGVALGRMAALVACILLSVGCGITNSPKQLRPPANVTPTAIVKDSIMIRAGSSVGISCRSWAGVKFYLYNAQYREVLANWLGRSGLTLVQPGEVARYDLESRVSKPDIIHLLKDRHNLEVLWQPTDLTYLLKDRQNGETVWQLTQPWPFRIQPNICRDEAMNHFAAVALELASWDGTPGEVIDHSAIAGAAAAYRNRVLRPSGPDTPLGELQAKIEKRYASGETPPVDIIDPHFDLVICEGLSQETAPVYIAIGVDFPSIACENTVAGQNLLLRRRWECSPEPTRNCVCGGRRGGSYSSIFDRPEFQSDSIYSEIYLGPLWDRFAVDPDKLTSWLIEPGQKLSLTPCSFEG